LWNDAPMDSGVVDFGSDLRKRTLLLCAVFAFAIATSVLLRGRVRRVQLLFAAFAGDIAAWYLAQALYGFLQETIWARFTAALSVLLPLFAVHLFPAMLPSNQASATKVTKVAHVLAVLVALLVASPYYGYGFARGIVFFYVFGLLAAALATLAVGGERSPSRATKARVRYLVVVGALATAGSLFDFLWFIGVEVPPIGAVMSVIFLFALAQSLARERLLDLYEVLGRLLVATALAFTLAGIFTVFVSVIGGLRTMYLNAVLAAFVILVLFEPLRTKVEERIHAIFFRERYDVESVVGSLRRRLAHALEVDEIQTTVLVALEESRRFTGAALYLREAGGATFELGGSFGVDAPTHIEVARSLVEHVVKSGALVLSEVQRAIDDSRGEAPELERLIVAASVLGPLREGVVLGIRAEANDVLGLLVVLDERVRDPFSQDEVTLLEGLAAQIGVGLENSRLYTKMKTRDRLAALGQMAAGLAHEIKNPLGAIKGAAQLLAEPAPHAPPLDAPSREFVGIILEEVDRLDRVVRSVLDYARPSADNPSPVDVNAVVRRTTQILESSSEGETRIELSLAESLPLALVDAEKLRQVLINLVQNAVQAMDGAAPVRITTQVRERRSAWETALVAEGDEAPAPGWVEIAVADSGKGISKKVLANLFEPFFTTKDRGTGLGLAISQRIVQAAGGRIDVTSREGAGTTFTILLPAASAEARVLRADGASEARLPAADEKRQAN
jgi:two-component system, NtrC family, sensor histidine kinase HydH